MIIELSEFFNNPSLVDIGFLKIQYYAVTWVLSAVLIFQYLKTHPIIKELELTVEQTNDVVFLYGLMFGAMLGGRVGYMLFYGLDQLAANPLSLLFIWEGGLSFHGGLVGVILSLYVYSIKQSISFLRLADAICAAMPIGLGLVRIGNFLNGELYGRSTDGSWGFIFPTDPYGLPRHPSQLYEAMLEGIILFIILMKATYKKETRTGVVSALFMILYGFFRIVAEQFREPDMQIGYLFNLLTMGSILSFSMILIGLFILKKATNNEFTK